MTFVLHRAERADVLAEVLAGILAVPPADPFTREVVAVHSRGVERWLAHRLSAHLGTSPGRADGVCAHLDFPFPGRLVQRALAEVTGLDPDADPWRPERLAWPLLDVVEANLHEPWMYVLAGHLGAGASPTPGTSPSTTGDAGDADDDLARRDRRFAAVRHLADLYDRYAVHRPAMVLAWNEGRDEDGDGRPLDHSVAWQAELWRRLRAAVGDPSPAERSADGCAALVAEPGLVDLPERLFLFGLTRLPASYFDVLEALAAHRDVHLLALHPSPAAWATDEQESLRHPLLRAWGRDSHEMGVVLRGRLAGATHAVTDDRHHPLPDHAAGDPSLLHRLQAAIRADDPPAGGAARVPLDPADRSLQVHACHGRARQAEVVRDAVTHLFAADPTLEPRDVVIMCPDIDDLAPLLRAAFDDDADDPRTIPYRLADRSLRQTNPVLGAMAELVSLVDARLTASQVLAFAALPPVRQRFGLDDDDIERVAAWIERTGTRWGLDADHRAPFDLAAVDTGTWDAGLQRLLLGVAMSEDELRLVGGVLPLDDVDSGDIDLAGRFAELVGRLGTAVRSLCDARPLAEWVEALGHAADLLLDTRWEDGWQRSQLDHLLTDVLDEASAGSAASTPLRLAEVRDLLADRLRGQPSRAAFRTGEMTMCTLVPMRSVPHRVVCLVGLDDGAFPRGGAPDGDDLLVAARHPGDHDRRAEDRQLLLDAVLAAGDHLVITYAGHDPRTNEALPPAVPVNELLDVVDAMATTADGRPAREVVVRHHPLQPADRRCFEAGALGTDGPWSFDPRLLAGARAAAGPNRPIAPFFAGTLAPKVDEGVLELADLVAAVEHPTRAFLRQRLGLSLRTDDDRPADALDLSLDGLGKWQVGDRILAALLEGRGADAVCAAERARGALPPGVLGERVLADTRTKADRIAEAARAIATGPSGSLEVDVALPDGRHVVGTVADVFPGGTIRPATFSSMSAKLRLRLWVHHLAASATPPGRALTSIQVARWGAKFRQFGLPPIDADVAVAHLADLATLRDEVLCAPLPLYCATSFAWVTAQRAGDEDPVAAAAKEWTSDFGWNREDRDAEHLLVHDGQRPLDDVLADPAFEALARRLWTPLLDEAKRWSS